MVAAIYSNFGLIGFIVAERVRFYRATACNATHGIAVAILSVRLSVCQSDACILTKLNDGLRIF